jgi:hypothetical protein
VALMGRLVVGRRHRIYTIHRKRKVKAGAHDGRRLQEDVRQSSALVR